MVFFVFPLRASLKDVFPIFENKKKWYVFFFVFALLVFWRTGGSGDSRGSNGQPGDSREREGQRGQQETKGRQGTARDSRGQQGSADSRGQGDSRVQQGGSREREGKVMFTIY